MEICITRPQWVNNSNMCRLTQWDWVKYGPLTRFAKLRGAHAHRLQRKPLVSDPGMHHGTCVMHVPWCMSGSLTRRWREKRSRHSRHMSNPQFYVSGKRPLRNKSSIGLHNTWSVSKRGQYLCGGIANWAQSNVDIFIIWLCLKVPPA